MNMKSEFNSCFRRVVGGVIGMSEGMWIFGEGMGWVYSKYLVYIFVIINSGFFILIVGI